MGKFASDFKEFIAKGNVVDMAVGVVIGGAFNKIVTSLVNDIIMPLVGLLCGGLDVTDWKWVIRAADEAAGTAENALAYGNFIQAIIDFLIVAFTLFVVLRVFTKLQNARKKEAAEEAKEEAKAE
ncbi:MAG: large-conductance mechanosensitive channel protein MscL [Clostridia bacterium]|nr:large-conductance mechanosensitive channel protein MscL [Clostridia bacterium]